MPKAPVKAIKTTQQVAFQACRLAPKRANAKQ